VRRSDAARAATAIVAAAGSGERLGAGGPKALVELAGRPMLSWSLEAFAGSAAVSACVVAAPPARESEIQDAAAGIQGLEVSVVTGGRFRSESVARALEPVETPIVAVHDAARPLVSPPLVDSLVEVLLDRPDAAGVIAASPLTDTIKRAREPRPAGGEMPRGGRIVAKTLSRELLWAAQTPQVFRADALREALFAEPHEVAAASDDAMLVEKAGGKVLMLEAPAENLKVTTGLDLRMAEALLRERAAAAARGREANLGGAASAPPGRDGSEC